MTQPRHSSRGRRLALVLAVAMVVAACGGGDSNDDGSANAGSGDTGGDGDPMTSAGDLEETLCQPPIAPITAGLGEPEEILSDSSASLFTCEYLFADAEPIAYVAYHDFVSILEDFGAFDPNRFEDLGDGNFISVDGETLLLAHRAGGAVEVWNRTGEAVDSAVLLAVGTVATDAVEGVASAQGVTLQDPDIEAPETDGEPGGDPEDIDLEAACDALDPAVVGDIIGLDITSFEADLAFEDLDTVSCDFVGPDIGSGLSNYIQLDFSGGFTLDWDERPRDDEEAFDGLDTEAFLAPGQDQEPGSKLFVRAGPDSTAGAVVDIATFDNIDLVRNELTDVQWLALGEHVLAVLEGLI